MRYCTSDDRDAILRVFTDDSTKEYCPTNRESIEYILKNSLVLMPDDDSVFIFKPTEYKIFEVHVAILPKARKYGRINGIRCFDWVFMNTICDLITASIPKNNRLCLMYARSNGMKPNGLSSDNYNFYITKKEFMEEVICRQ